MHSNKSQGFSLIELMSALLILTFGLLGVGRLLYVAASTASLARSKSTAAAAAQNKLEYLEDLYNRDPLAEDLRIGSHGPQQTRVVNPEDGSILNRYGVDWTVIGVSDPRPGKVLDARLLRVTITPVQSAGALNSHPALNKILSITTVLSRKIK